mmetsp:Transcript_129152/g.413970  ORF Transcript_129152/g.413970 Transcript_129152/m.413970 type:complete len:212 (+) Transcript_129152:512-1147(+)
MMSVACRVVQQATLGKHGLQRLGRHDECVAVEPRHKVAAAVFQGLLDQADDGPLHPPRWRPTVVEERRDLGIGEFGPVKSITMQKRIKPVQVMRQRPVVCDFLRSGGHEPAQVRIQRPVGARVRGDDADALGEANCGEAAPRVVGGRRGRREERLAAAGRQVRAAAVGAEGEQTRRPESKRRMLLKLVLDEAEDLPQLRGAQRGVEGAGGA